MRWALLPLGMPRECDTQDCDGAASWELEVSGVASCYCQTCKDKIVKTKQREALADMAAEARRLDLK